jgi:tetratricopeptide (TPR) repeat protein
MRTPNRRQAVLFTVPAAALLAVLLTGPAVALSLSGWDEGASAHRQVIANAVENEEPVIVYFHTDWCPWCRRLNQEYLADGTVAQHLRRVRKVAINPERGDDERALFRQYGASGFPSFYVYVPAFDGTPKKLSPFRGRGASTPEQFAREIDLAIAQEYDAKGYAYSQRKQHRRAIAYYQRALEYDADNVYACHAIAVSYQHLADASRDATLLSRARDYYRRTLEIDPDNEASKRALAGLQDL